MTLRLPKTPSVQFRTEAEDALGLLAVGGVQVPVDGGDLLGPGRGQSGDDGVPIDTSMPTWAAWTPVPDQLLVQVDRPVAQGRGGGVALPTAGTGSMEPAPARALGDVLAVSHPTLAGPGLLDRILTQLPPGCPLLFG
ncbi:hypothetical protein [Streptomyces sp. NPDC058695]|uniref:hypothetical protein n=1 Tax=Streptomyces sp. NPDC058695 TaxID=3346604 RepID=UPI0036616B6C